MYAGLGRKRTRSVKTLRVSLSGIYTVSVADIIYALHRKQRIFFAQKSLKNRRAFTDRNTRVVPVKPVNVFPDQVDKLQGIIVKIRLRYPLRSLVVLIINKRISLVKQSTPCFQQPVHGSPIGRELQQLLRRQMCAIVFRPLPVFLALFLVDLISALFCRPASHKRLCYHRRSNAYAYEKQHVHNDVSPRKPHPYWRKLPA